MAGLLRKISYLPAGPIQDPYCFFLPESEKTQNQAYIRKFERSTSILRKETNGFFIIQTNARKEPDIMTFFKSLKETLLVSEITIAFLQSSQNY